MGKEMKKLAMFPIVVLLLSIFAPMVFATTTTFYSTASDGEISHADAVFNTAWAETIADLIDDTAGSLWFVISSHNGSHYRIGRSAFFFNVSLPDGAIISSATLSFHGAGTLDTDSGHFDIVVQNGQPTYPHDPLVVGDYDKSHYSGDGGSINSADWNINDWNDITLNADGRSWIGTEGTTKFLIRSSTDIAGTAPGTVEFNDVTVDTMEEGFDVPKLTVVYTVPPSVGAGEAAATHMETAALTMATLMTLFVILWGLSGKGQLREVLAYLIAIAVILIVALVVKTIG